MAPGSKHPNQSKITSFITRKRAGGRPKVKITLDRFGVVCTDTVTGKKDRILKFKKVPPAVRQRQAHLNDAHVKQVRRRLEQIGCSKAFIERMIEEVRAGKTLVSLQEEVQ